MNDNINDINKKFPFPLHEQSWYWTALLKYKIMEEHITKYTHCTEYKSFSNKVKNNKICTKHTSTLNY